MILLHSMKEVLNSGKDRTVITGIDLTKIEGIYISVVNNAIQFKFVGAEEHYLSVKTEATVDDKTIKELALAINRLKNEQLCTWLEDLLNWVKVE